MNRKEFFFELWRKIIAPTIILAAVYLSFRFLGHAAENGNWKLYAAVTSILAGAGILIYATNMLIKKLAAAASQIPIPAWLHMGTSILSRIFTIAAPIVVGILFYLGWEKDRFLATCFILYYLVPQISRIIREEKEKHTEPSNHKSFQ